MNSSCLAPTPDSYSPNGDAFFVPITQGTGILPSVYVAMINQFPSPCCVCFQTGGGVRRKNDARTQTEMGIVSDDGGLGVGS